MKINRKGFTLIELLGVLVVLVAILLVALPNIATTFEKQKNKINEQRIETIKSAGAIYASRKKKDIKYDEFLSGTCGISIQSLLSEDLITMDELKDSEGNPFYNNHAVIFIIYVSSSGEYKIEEKASSFGC